MTVDAVVLSTGRAGSGYIARVLTEAGVPCGHEAVYGLRKNVRPELRCCSSWLALPAVEDGRHRGAVFQQVRHPLDVLSSLLNGQMQSNAARPYAHFQRANMAGDYPDPDVDGWAAFAVAFVADWQRRCETHAGRTWRVEDVTGGDVAAVAEACGVVVDAYRAADVIASVPASVNRHPPGPDLDWGGLPDGRWTDLLRRQADRYGYAVG